MGQQQLLLVVLGIIIVGVAIVVGINLFSANAVEVKRNNVINELLHLSAHAQRYYRTPTAYGGGSSSFTGWTIPNDLISTPSGRYEAVVKATQILLKGIGNEVVTGNDSIEVHMTVHPSTYQVEIIR